MKKRILILCGGISKERSVSLDTGKQVANELKKNQYIIKTCEPDKNLLKNINLFKPSIIFNALHGQFGEDGYGAKASKKLLTVRGKDFQHEKTKKKRGSYRGGEITLKSNSFKYEDSE